MNECPGVSRCHSLKVPSFAEVVKGTGCAEGPSAWGIGPSLAAIPCRERRPPDRAEQEPPVRAERGEAVLRPPQQGPGPDRVPAGDGPDPEEQAAPPEPARGVPDRRVELGEDQVTCGQDVAHASGRT